MAEFDQLQKIWKSQQPTQHLPAASAWLHKARTTKDKLVRQVAISCLVFLSVAVYTLILQQSLVLSEAGRYAIFGLAIVCMGQSIVQGYAWHALLTIDELQPPAVYASAWEHYYRRRKKIIHISGPTYFIFINMAMVIFFIDALATYTIWQRILISIGYTIWVLAGWFVIRKKILRKEDQQITETIANLNIISEHLQNETLANETPS